MDCQKARTKNFQVSAWMHHIQGIVAIISVLHLTACSIGYSVGKPETQPTHTSGATDTPVPTVSPVAGSDTPIAAASLPPSTANRELLEESWDIYREKFIQVDGRVIDYEASDRSVSEGQAYAMLRAVFIDDPKTFDLTLKWAENNLKREVNGKRTDQLWAWTWGRNKAGKWGTIDANFASDADIDAVTSLILAYRRWKRPKDLKLAKIKLRDLWNLSTAPGPGGKRYLLPGPVEAFVPSATTIYLNPSYLAPYAFRLFAQVDPERDWLSLVDTSYEVLEKSTQLSAVGLPSDWVALDTKTGKYQPLPPSSQLQTLYSFDAYRVWWRVGLDAAWFESPQARSYLQRATKHLQTVWQKESRLPARIDLQGKALVNYEATSQYAMLYSAMQLIEPKLAEELLQNKLLSQYKQGIWDDESAYYTQNLAWLGLLPPTVVPDELLRPK